MKNIILLDDILSELDKERQNFVLSQIENMQVFITQAIMREMSMIRLLMVSRCGIAISMRMEMRLRRHQ